MATNLKHSMRHSFKGSGGETIAGLELGCMVAHVEA